MSSPICKQHGGYKRHHGCHKRHHGCYKRHHEAGHIKGKKRKEVLKKMRGSIEGFLKVKVNDKDNQSTLSATTNDTDC